MLKMLKEFCTIKLSSENYTDFNLYIYKQGGGSSYGKMQYRPSSNSRIPACNFGALITDCATESICQDLTIMRNCNLNTHFRPTDDYIYD